MARGWLEWKDPATGGGSIEVIERKVSALKLFQTPRPASPKMVFQNAKVLRRWINPLVALKTNAIISRTLSFASFESMEQLKKDFTFNEVQSHHEIRPPCLTEQGLAVIQHGYFCNNGVK